MNQPQPLPDGRLTPVQRRTAGPIALRLYRTATPPFAQSCHRNAQSCEPAWCDDEGLLVTELSTEAVAARVSSEIIGLAPGSHLSVLEARAAGTVAGGTSGPAVGVAEGAPVQLQTVRVSSDVATLRLVTPDGEDRTAPSPDGLAALAVSGASTTGRLTALDAAGHELAGVDLPSVATTSGPACRPVPPELPPAGRQPPDAADAERAVRVAYTTAFTHAPATEPDRALTAVEDGEQLRPALDQLRRSFPEAVATATVSTDRVVLISPTTAAVRFTLSYSGGAPYGTTDGRAVFRGGRWLVERGTYCSVLTFGGASCSTG